MKADLRKQIKNNLIWITTSIAFFYCAAVMMTALAPITIVLLTKKQIFAGLPSAIFLIGSAIAAYPAGKAMDKLGRMPVVCVGFFVGILGSILVAYAISINNSLIIYPGFMILGTASSAILLVRLAGADMLPLEKQGRGIGFILMGAVIGGIIGPALLMPLTNDYRIDNEFLILGWHIGTVFLFLGMAVSLFVRPDPKKFAIISFSISSSRAEQLSYPRSLKTILNESGVKSCIFSSVISHSLMTSMMSLASLIMLKHELHQNSIFIAVGVHFVGMFGLALFTGYIIDAIGYSWAINTGLILVGLSFGLIIFSDSALYFYAVMILLGLGWNMAFITSTTKLSSLVHPFERGKIIGFNDFTGCILGALLSVAGGMILANDYGPKMISLCGMSLVTIALIFNWLEPSFSQRKKQI